jgi:aryl-alcohol dehydrogenase-like predicted oxidoreductase
VIAGATKPAQVEANVKAVASTLSAEDLAALDTLTA